MQSHVLRICLGTIVHVLLLTRFVSCRSPQTCINLNKPPLSAKLDAFFFSQHSINSIKRNPDFAGYKRENQTFEAEEATIQDIHVSLLGGRVTCHEIVSRHLARIEALNPHINAIITLNPDILSVVQELDDELISRTNGPSLSPLFCVPVLLKDNFDEFHTPTTAGSRALADLRPSIDAPTVSQLKAAGAVIVGKTNMQELALEGLTVSSLGGQTLNPYDLTRTPGGSSGGSGAALAASFATLATGTDTMNSLRSPASANCLFSLRPTRGLISRTGVMPVSEFQDTVGPMARTVDDLASMFQVMLTKKHDMEADEDEALKEIPGPRTFEYVRPNDPKELNLVGFRFGILESFFDWTDHWETIDVNNIIGRFLSRLQAAGAELVPVQSAALNTLRISDLDVQGYEVAEDVNGYLSKHSHSGSFPRSFPAIFNRAGSDDYLVIPRQYGYISTALSSSRRNHTYAAKREAIKELRNHLEWNFDELKLDFMLYPEQRNLVVKVGAPSQKGRNGHLAVLTGSPVLTMPAGFTDPTETAPRGVPVGIEMLGRHESEEDLFRTAAIIERLTRLRKPPRLQATHPQRKEYNSLPTIKPNTKDIPAEYPIGVC